MSQTEKNLTRKKVLQLKEIEIFYKVLKKYNLKEEAYKSLLQVYIKCKREKRK
ncbi:MAG: hypothetical protein ACR2M7_04900 [Bdellovibrionales bacterium]